MMFNPEEIEALKREKQEAAAEKEAMAAEKTAVKTAISHPEMGLQAGTENIVIRKTSEPVEIESETDIIVRRLCGVSRDLSKNVMDAFKIWNEVMTSIANDPTQITKMVEVAEEEVVEDGSNEEEEEVDTETKE